MIDTHAHIYAEEFDADRDAVIERAKAAGVEKIILPGIDSSSFGALLSLEEKYPGYCHAAIGLHPTSVKSDYQQELELVEFELKRRTYIAIGEIGIDLYWDQTFVKEQILVFQQQLKWAVEYNKPVIIHVRNSFRETMQAMEPYRNSGLKGVFHSFSGDFKEASEIIKFGGFLLGINGIITFRNSGLGSVVQQIDIKHLVLETDAPYLTPVPYRGKRNESAFLSFTANHIAALYSMPYDAVIEQTTKNALNLFNLSSKN
ncbi:MAG: TatD family hydrolase [Paludibacter sp.]|nr:TatD family hydrolase [Paludibacter sp.]MDD4198496.1 TatD family hydrolase [Paludibacter sp.]MDD4427593.1 TatD family hydrolase [Paludibacter sp.]